MTQIQNGRLGIEQSGVVVSEQEQIKSFFVCFVIQAQNVQKTPSIAQNVTGTTSKLHVVLFNATVMHKCFILMPPM